jgi:fatty acid desaturase
MAKETSATKIDWYRIPLGKDELRSLTRRSDLKGLAQTLGHLGLLFLTGGLCVYGVGRWPWYALVMMVFVHGTLFAFLLNAFHELCHNSVFKSRWLNRFFLYLISFISLHDPIYFTASHSRHHKYTLHPPDDLEVVLPERISRAQFMKNQFINPKAVADMVRIYWHRAFGRLSGEWSKTIFPEDQPLLRRRLRQWAILNLVGHAVIVVVSFSSGYWMIPIVTTFARGYGSWLMILCNATQHIGLKDNVADYRLCCRTIELNPFLRFLYWYMNYHIEHHMYAAVPCYNLRKLHRRIENQLPPTPQGLVATWTQIAWIQRKQDKDPAFQYEAALPTAV